MRAALTILWEQHRNAWRGLAGLLVVLLIYHLLLEHVDDFIYWVLSNNYSLGRAVAFMPVVGALAVLFMTESRGRLTFDFPRRILTLPLSTRALVFLPLMYRIIAVLMLTFVGGYLCSRHLQPHYLHAPQLLIAVIVVTALQALVALRAGFGSGTGIALFSTLLIATAVLITPLLQVSQSLLSLGNLVDAGTELPAMTSTAWTTGLIAIAGWILVTWRATVRARSEVPEDPVGRFTGFIQAIAYFERDDRPFQHPTEAQRWFEWRRGAYLFPWTALGLGLLLLIAFQVAGDTLESRFLIPFNLLAVAPLVVATITGYSVTRFNREYGWFVCPRPLDTKMIVRARFWAAAWGMGIGYLLLFTAFILTHLILYPGTAILPSLVEDFRAITSTQGSYGQGIVLLAAFLGGIFMMVWTLFWVARAASMLLAVAGVIASLWSAVFGPIVFVSEYRYLTPSGILFYAFTVLSFLALIAVLTLALRRSMISGRFVAGLFLTWLALCITATSARHMVFPDEFVALLAWLAIPAIPLAAVPLTVALQRNR